MDSNPSDSSAVDDVPQTLEPTLQDSRDIMAHYRRAFETLRDKMREKEVHQDPGQLQKNK